MANESQEICLNCNLPFGEHAREQLTGWNEHGWAWRENACPIGEGPFHPTQTFSGLADPGEARPTPQSLKEVADKYRILNYAEVDRLTSLVEKFSTALLDKLCQSERKYEWNGGWFLDNWADDLRKRVREHLEKGDPRDVAAYCAFAWHHEWSLADKPRDGSGEARPTPPDVIPICAECNSPITVHGWTCKHGASGEARLREALPNNPHGWRSICACCGCQPSYKSCKFNCACHEAALRLNSDTEGKS